MLLDNYILSSPSKFLLLKYDIKNYHKITYIIIRFL